jgi:release factor glutamine methyltransferase
VEAALALAKPGATVIDVGCGSGAIAVTLALETHARLIATDVSMEALLVAADNAHRLDAPVDFVAGDLLSMVRRADVIVSNPPYVPAADRTALQREVRDFEPPVALFGGVTGLEIYQQLIQDARRVLEHGGWLVVELGFGLSGAVRAMLRDDWSEVQVIPDLAGIPRVLVGRWKS